MVYTCATGKTTLHRTAETGLRHREELSNRLRQTRKRNLPASRDRLQDNDIPWSPPPGYHADRHNN